VWAVLELLDRQIVDPEGRLAGKVDDLELEAPDDPEALPIVTAILSGPGALAAQIGGEAGRWLASVERRLSSSPDQAPSRIPFGLVRRVDYEVAIAVPHEELETSRAERWARDVLIDKIPGSRHAAD
jgi:hypothetical protein